MADEELVARLRQSVQEWNSWRENEPALPRLDLTWANLVRADLSGANLSGANLTNADLTGANLTRANLSGADLTGVSLHQAQLFQALLSDATLTSAHISMANLTRTNLTRANLTGAILVGAHLVAADFTMANFAGANLSDANFSGANLSQANLTEASLASTNLNQVNLTEANLARAEFLATVLADVDLSQSKNLHSVIHRGPSTIGLDTLIRSNAAIPEAFLRGAGVPDSLIAYATSLVGKPFEFYSCFISYSHADKAFARRLHDTLQGQGVRCWLDDHQLLPGDDIYDGVDRGIRQWDKVLLCCSQHSLTSRWVDTEIGKALQKEERLWNEREQKVLSLIPLDLDGHLLSGKWTSGKASLVLERRAADFTGWESSNSKFEQAVEQVIKALRADEGAREQPPPAML